MLQYTVHPPPLSVSFSKKNSAANLKFRNNDPRRPSAPPPLPPMPRRDDHPSLTGQDSFQRLPPLPPHLSLPDEYDDLPSPSFPPASLPKPISRPNHRSIIHHHNHHHQLQSPSSPTSYFPSPAQSFSSSSSHVDIPDVLRPGDIVGPSVLLRQEPVRLADLPASRPPATDQPPPDAEFEVVRKLGTGSYAVVYLVREILSRPSRLSSDDGHVYAGGKLDFDISPRSSVEYGREYAIKVLSKANLDHEALDAQLFEATVHQSLPSHPNLVSLHRTYETPSYLLLLLEFVPGEDLFYFLEQARDHYVPSTPASPTESRTPPTPGLLSSIHPSQLLSPVRLRLVASMFAQMCEAVAVCHDSGVFHRDIKPENFIVTDGRTVDGERKVVVKLSDFGLSTTDVESSDMDCGSAPYMSYECRNNLAPTYRPRAADVWSLGIVLINMLYHCNPWSDTADGVCGSFSAYRAAPQQFLLSRFPGMTPIIANFLATRVFCLLPDPNDEAPRCSAREFAAWVRDLPTHFIAAAASRTVSARGHSRGASTSSISGHALGSVPPSRRPSSRVGSVAMSRVPSGIDIAEERLAPVLCEVLAEEADGGREAEMEIIEEAREPAQDAESRTSTSTKRRKRGARKGKGAAQHPPPPPPPIDTSETLALASQELARELSRAARRSATSSPAAHHSALSSPVPVKKPSIWKLSFGSKTSEGHKEREREEASSKGRAAHVSDLILGLNAAPVPSAAPSQTTSAESSRDDERHRTRGRQPREPAATAFGGPFGSGAASAFGSRSSLAVNSINGEKERERESSAWRAHSPVGSSVAAKSPGRSPTRSTAAHSSTASSWRNSMASTNTSSSAFTRYSNQSVRSVSTYATSISSAASESGNWRAKPSSSSTTSVASGATSGKDGKGKARRAQYPYPYAGGIPPPNVKIMTGVPKELGEFPRQLHPHGDMLGLPPQPRPRRSKLAPPSAAAKPPADHGLGTISESRVDAGTSTTDLALDDGGGEDGPRKVPRGQINALAKMLGALRR